MLLANHYNKLYNNSINTIQSKGCETDHLINGANDKRFGITLVIRPPLQVKIKIQEFLSELNKIDSSQYYYPNSDIHITVMSIISCYNNFALEKIDVSKYINIIEESIQNIEKFNILFKGITASPSCIMVQGFLKENMLENLRNNLRTNFHNSYLEQTIDKRYAIQTAHSTIIRFQNQLTSKNEYLNLIEKYRDFDFGEFKVDEIELVFNDWYQRKKSVQKLHLFKI
jgi:2'-5' RNA ligase